MPYRITYALDQHGPLAERALNHLLACLYAIDVAYLQKHPETPLLAKSKVQYFADPDGQDDWQDIPSTLFLGCGDAEDLVAWRAAERTVREKRPSIPVVMNGRIVIRSQDPKDISIEDIIPSNAPLIDTSRLGRVTFRLDLFNGNWEKDLSRRALTDLLEALYRIDVDYLRTHPNTPDIYSPAAGQVYMEEPTGQEDWQDVPTALKMKISDCEDLACWLAAQKTVRGTPAKPFYSESKLPSGAMLFHIRVRDQRGRIEDPSWILGMR